MSQPGQSGQSSMDSGVINPSILESTVVQETEDEADNNTAPPASTPSQVNIRSSQSQPDMMLNTQEDDNEEEGDVQEDEENEEEEEEQDDGTTERATGTATATAEKASESSGNAARSTAAAAAAASTSGASAASTSGASAASTSGASASTSAAAAHDDAVQEEAAISAALNQLDTSKAECSEEIRKCQHEINVAIAALDTLRKVIIFRHVTDCHN